DCNEVLIIKIDEQSYHETHQQWGTPWERSLHTQLLRKLQADHSGLVVFDVWFPDTNREPADVGLAGAIRSYGRVVLPAVFAPVSVPGLGGRNTLLPWD